MTRAGRFLYLDWAQAQVKEWTVEDGEKATVSHDGYRRLGVIHERSVTALPGDRWIVEDSLQCQGGRPAIPHTYRLHWLLPDWPWEITKTGLRLSSPPGPVALAIRAHSGDWDVRGELWLVRAGEILAGSGSLPHLPILGWFSPTYAVKMPALSLVIEAQSEQETLTFITEWQFGE